MLSKPFFPSFSSQLSQFISLSSLSLSSSSSSSTASLVRQSQLNDCVHLAQSLSSSSSLLSSSPSSSLSSRVRLLCGDDTQQIFDDEQQNLVQTLACLRQSSAASSSSSSSSSSSVASSAASSPTHTNIELTQRCEQRLHFVRENTQMWSWNLKEVLQQSRAWRAFNCALGRIVRCCRWRYVAIHVSAVCATVGKTNEKNGRFVLDWFSWIAFWFISRSFICLSFLLSCSVVAFSYEFCACICDFVFTFFLRCFFPSKVIFTWRFYFWWRPVLSERAIACYQRHELYGDALALARTKFTAKWWTHYRYFALLGTKRTNEEWLWTKCDVLFGIASTYLCTRYAITKSEWSSNTTNDVWNCVLCHTTATATATSTNTSTSKSWRSEPSDTFHIGTWICVSVALFCDTRRRKESERK